MDAVSYLLGKQSSGGGGLDWSAIGYSGTPQVIEDGYNYAVEIKNNWTPSINLTMRYSYDYNLSFMPFVDTSIATTMQSMFSYSYGLISVPLLNTSNVTNMREMFRGCRALKTVPQFDTSKVTNIYGMFYDCSLLKTLPLLDTSALNTGSSINSVFVNCLNLSDQSLDNILQMCINATSLPSSVPKTLFNLGITSTTAYPASRIQALPHYQDFIDAGWTIGY